MATPSILNEFARHWWVLLLRGILAIAFGFFAFAMPGLALVTLVLIFGLFALADGFAALWVGAKAHTWGLALVGVLGIIVGAYAFLMPGLTAVALLYLIAIWAIVRGVFEVVTAVQLRKEIPNEWALIMSGAVSILLGVALFARPAAGAVAMVWLIGVFALAVGFMMIVLAFRVRAVTHDVGRVAHV